MGFIGDIVGDVVGGITGSTKATKNATAAALQAQRENNALAEKIYGQTKGTLDPFIKSGTGAMGTYNALLNINGTTPAAKAQAQAAFNNYLNSSGYQFQLGEGQRAINTNQAAAGLLGSGSTLKSLQKFGQGLGAQYFNNYLNQVGNQQAAGLSAANALAGVGTNYTGQVSVNNDSAASAIGNANLARSANNTNFLGSLASAAAAFSDIRCKVDINRVGEFADGLPIYTFRYQWDEPAITRTGVMAHEVAELRPWALGPIVMGLQTVNYTKLEAA